MTIPTMTAATMAKAEFFLPILAKITENTRENAKKYSLFPYRSPVCGKDTEKIKFFLRNSLIPVAK